MKDYDFETIEKKWQKYWQEHKCFVCNMWDFSKPKFYALDMFPYPSGVGLHVGHPEGYTATDIVSRMKRMQGYNVLHPMGYDSFGLPAEQYALETGNHPAEFTKKNIEHFTSQLKELGFDYDWSRVIYTSDPSYYKWTQWIFKQLYKDGYAKYLDMPVNWCEELGTVLAYDEIVDGKSERGGYPVVRKMMRQLCIDQVAFAKRLLEGLETIDWPESTKEMQRNWIGKSDGVEVDFKLVNGGSFSIFTTCIETIYGITFMVLAPDSELVQSLMDKIENKDEVKKYIEQTLKKSERERSEIKDKSGCELKGIKAINPVNNKEVPVYIGDFVLASYGTGAVMAVPSHDQRDFEYAKSHNLEMIQVIEGKDVSEHAFEKQDYLDKDYKLINSEEFSGLTVKEAKEAITCKLEKMGVARRVSNYHFREWIFARQRYWGEPVPIVHLDNGEEYLLEDDELPLVLPNLKDYKGHKGKAPLENALEWKTYNKNGIKGIRETSTMPGSAGSSWYYLRYIDPHNDKELANYELLKYWMPVDLYVGGPEHTVGHLMYARIWNNYLYDKGLSPVKEPFKKLVHQGMILGENGIKMGKRYAEYVVNPSDIVKNYGADTLRLYEMFMGPLEASKPWSSSGVEGSKKFLDRVWRLYQEGKIKNQENKELEYLYHFTVKKVSEDYESLNFNTAISQMMIFINAVYKSDVFPYEYALGFLKLLNPVAPHISEELNEMLGNKEVLANSKWPSYDSSKLEVNVIEIAVQVNGKLKGTIKVNKDEDEEITKQSALDLESVKRAIENKTIKKVIVVKNRIVSIVVI